MIVLSASDYNVLDMDPTTGLIVGLGAVFALAYIWAAAYITADTLAHGGPGWLVGIVALIALPFGLVIWVMLRRGW